MTTPTTDMALRWRSAARTDPGCVRTVNEDACLERPEAGLWVVADGMGGHDAGDLASRMVVEALAEPDPEGRLSALVDTVEDRIVDANRRLHALSGDGQGVTSGTTVVCLVAGGDRAVALWAGDSRLYRLREGRLTQLTQDHSQIEAMVEEGLLLRVDAERHPDANVITRAVGGEPELFLDAELWALEAGDRYLLCSDGLYKELREPEVAEILAQGTPEAVADALVESARARGARDNVTVVVVDVEAG